MGNSQSVTTQNDEELARELAYEYDFEILLEDRRLAERLSREVEEGQEELYHQAPQAARDYELAVQLAREEGTLPEDHEDHYHHHQGHHHGHHHHEVALPHDAPPSADDPVAQQAEAPENRSAFQRSRRCASCMEQTPAHEVVQAPCGDWYCHECLQNLFRAAMTDESLFPPRCCGQHIPVPRVRLALGAQLAQNFEVKAVELSTPNRTYCHDPHCSAFIAPTSIAQDVGTCPRCRARTCTMCKSQAHRGDCPQDEALNQLLETARDEGWRRCADCKRIIELQYGCNHMTCHCGHQFCYVCGTNWKHCRCPQWHEERLYNRAAQIVDRRPPRVVHAAGAAPQPPNQQARAGPAGPPAIPLFPQRQELIQRMANQLNGNANCMHPLNWGAISNDRRGQCELCNRYLSRVYACRRCGIAACYRCRKNRL